MASTARTSRQDFWRQMVQRQAASGLSIRRFCRRHDLREPTFYAWRARLGAEAATPVFVPVEVRESSATAGAAGPPEPCALPGLIEIVLGGGQRVRLHGPVERALLRTVLAVVAECAPAVSAAAAARQLTAEAGAC